MSIMKKSEALNIVKEALGDKIKDKRTKVSKAILSLEEWAKWENDDLERIIDETLAELNSTDNDFFEDN